MHLRALRFVRTLAVGSLLHCAPNETYGRETNESALSRNAPQRRCTSVHTLQTPCSVPGDWCVGEELVVCLPRESDGQFYWQMEGNIRPGLFEGPLPPPELPV